MKRNTLVFLAMAILLCIASCKPETEQSNSNTKPQTETAKAKPLEQKELNDVAAVIAGGKQPKYIIKEIGEKADGKEQSLAGLILMVRKPDYLKDIGGGALTDDKNSLVRIGTIDAEGKTNAALSYFVEDHSTLTIDVDGDRIVDLAEWLGPDDRKWRLFNENAQGLDKSCFNRESSEIESDFFSNCLAKTPNSTFSGGITVANLLFGFDKELSCQKGGVGTNIVKPSDRRYFNQQARESDKKAAIYRNEAVRSRANGNVDLANAYDEAASAHQNHSSILRQIQGHQPITQDDRQQAFESLRAVVAAETRLLRLQPLSVSPTLPLPPMNPDPPTNPNPLAPAPHNPTPIPLNKPLPDSAYIPEDPRCKQIETDKARGSLFMNKDFCKGDDPITCLARQEDSTRDLTGGSCRTEPGPDGNNQLVCTKNPDPLDPSNPKPDYAPADAPIPKPYLQKLAQNYIDLTPIGGIIVATICPAAQGGPCGGNP